MAQRLTYEVLYDFKAQTASELTVQAGDIVELVHDYKDGWTECTFHGVTGLLPVTFIKRYERKVVDNKTQSPTPPQSKSSFDKIRVQVFEGKDLVKKDLFSSDPYCVIKVGESEEQRTRIVYSSLNPTWKNEIFFFDRPAKKVDEYVKINLFDHDRFSKDDPMGEAVVPLSSLTSGVNDLWLKLKHAKSGEIHVTIAV